MVIISLTSDTNNDWYKANWVYRQLAETVFVRFPDDEEMHEVLEMAHAFRALDFVGLNATNKTVATRTLVALKTVAEETLQRKIIPGMREHPNDKVREQQYLSSLTELLKLIERYELEWQEN
jgi:hypothetical protein